MVLCDFQENPRNSEGIGWGFFPQGGVQQERYAVFDPLTKVQGKMLFLQKDQLLKSWSGKAVFIRMEMRGCSVDGKQTSLYCLASIVKHYGDDTDVGRLMHEYAISEDEPSLKNWTKSTGRPAPAARTARPTAAVVFPFPSPQ